MLCGGVCVLWWMAHIVYALFSDVCQGAEHTKFICEQYRQGMVSGSLCGRMCDRQEVRLSYCIQNEPITATFVWNGKLEVRVNARHVWSALTGEARVLVDDVKSVPFSQPEQGKSMEEFRTMVHEYLEVKLGAGDHSTVVERAMSMADSNKDGKVTLSEAKSIWSLLQNSEFFMRFIFADTEHLPALQGFCGDMYAFDYVTHRQLYNKQHSPLLSYFLANTHRWLWPRWPDRAKVAVGLLEFTMEAYQHGSEGTFHMCNINESQVGYNDKFDVKILQTADIIPTKELLSMLEGRSCHSDDDCRYSEQCGTECLMTSAVTSGRCGAALLRPSLYYVCKIIEEYVLQDAPSSLSGDMDRLLGRCSQLGKDNEKSQVEQSLILNDLKLLLWKRISYR